VERRLTLLNWATRSNNYAVPKMDRIEGGTDLTPHCGRESGDPAPDWQMRKGRLWSSCRERDCWENEWSAEYESAWNV